MAYDNLTPPTNPGDAQIVRIRSDRLRISACCRP